MRRIGRMSGNALWVGASLVGLAVFLLVQVFPFLWKYADGDTAVLSRLQAAERAAGIAEKKFGIARDPASVVVTHLTESAAVGYFSKENLLSRYEKEWSHAHPTDVFRADVQWGDGRGYLSLFLHMNSGKLLGWRDHEAYSPPEMQKKPETPAEAARRALAYAAWGGEPPGDWEWNGQAPDAQGRVTFLSRSHSALGEARLKLDVIVPPEFSALSSAVPPWKNGSVTYSITVPESFTAYVAEQRSRAGRMNALGFDVPQLALFVLSIVYAATRRDFTSFRRGIVLASLFLAMYLAFYFNLIPGFRAALFENGLTPDSSSIASLLVVNFIVLLAMAVFTYFAAVAGDGLWKSMGRSLWPRWRQADFGASVLSGMKKGYLLAFLLLGVQSLILIGLQNGIGMFQSSDASQSTYNMTIPWLLLLLAWCAGISEEMQSRFFGIALFRSWLIGGASRVLGRNPSPRTASALTSIAMLPPGLVWAFGHVGYAVYPAYSRLIELVLMALLFGWFLLRFGLIAVIFAHVVLDTMLMGIQLIFDAQPGNLPPSLIGFCMPAIVGYAIWWAHARWGGIRRMR